MFVDGAGYLKIVETLNELGYKTKKGKYFSKTSVYDILRQEKYIGNYFYRVNGEKIYSKEKIPIIVDEDLFVEAQKMFRKNKGYVRRGKRVYLLSGILECGECGGKYVGDGRKSGTMPNYIVYSCTTRSNKKGCKNLSIRKENIEKYVLEKLKEVILSEVSMNKIVENVMEIQNKSFVDYNKEKIKIERKIMEVDAKIQKYFVLYEEDGISGSMLSSKIKELEEQKEKLKIHLVDAELSNNKTCVTESMVREYLLLYKEGIFSQDEEMQKKAIDAFVDKVIITREEIKIIFKIFSEESKENVLNKLTLPQESLKREEVYTGRAKYAI